MGKRTRAAAVAAVAFLTAAMASAQAPRTSPALTARARPGQWALVLHGGAGVIERSSMKPEAEQQYRAGLTAAAGAAAAVLNRNGAALDAVTAALTLLEDDPNFNAGRGAFFTADGKNELDAALRDGATMKAGSVAGVTTTRHPILLARAVMERSPHVMLIGSGADDFAKTAGLEEVPPSFFFTERRWDSLVKQLQKEGSPIPPRPEGAPPAPANPQAALETSDTHKYGTVGIVVRDRAGNIAAGTSTGGTQAKRFHRVGDTPIIGAGTYASNQSCAVSATGTGEFFIRLTVARTICALVQYRGMPLQAAADEVVQKELGAIHGDGGIIALTPDGQLAWSFNTPGMFRARLVEGGAIEVGIYRDEP